MSKTTFQDDKLGGDRLGTIRWTKVVLAVHFYLWNRKRDKVNSGCPQEHFTWQNGFTRLLTGFLDFFFKDKHKSDVDLVLTCFTIWTSSWCYPLVLSCGQMLLNCCERSIEVFIPDRPKDVSILQNKIYQSIKYTKITKLPKLQKYTKWKCCSHNRNSSDLALVNIHGG